MIVLGFILESVKLSQEDGFFWCIVWANIDERIWSMAGEKEVFNEEDVNGLKAGELEALELLLNSGEEVGEMPKGGILMGWISMIRRKQQARNERKAQEEAFRAQILDEGRDETGRAAWEDLVEVLGLENKVGKQGSEDLMSVIKKIIKMNGLLWVDDFGDQINLNGERFRNDAEEIPNYEQIIPYEGSLYLRLVPFTSLYTFPRNPLNSPIQYRLPKRRRNDGSIDYYYPERNYYKTMEEALMNGFPKSRVGVDTQVVSEDQYLRRIEELLSLIIGYNARELALFVQKRRISRLTKQQEVLQAQINNAHWVGLDYQTDPLRRATILQEEAQRVLCEMNRVGSQVSGLNQLGMKKIGISTTGRKGLDRRLFGPDLLQEYLFQMGLE